MGAMLAYVGFGGPTARLPGGSKAATGWAEPARRGCQAGLDVGPDVGLVVWRGR